MPSFKVPCPSCEAQVLIKNPNLVGTKVECPKCKYRFKVEEPAADAPAADAKKDDGEKKGKGKKKKSKAGGVIAVVAAVLVLGVGGYFVLSGDKKTSNAVAKGPGPVTPRPVTPPAGDGKDQTPPEGGGDEQEKKGDDEKKEVPKVVVKTNLPRSDKDATNLLPGQSVAVYHFDLDQMKISPFFNGLADENTARMFKDSMGFDLESLGHYYHCVVGAERAGFGVMRLKHPVAAKDVLGAMKLEPAPKSIKTRNLHTIKSNPLVSAVGQALAGRSVLSDLYKDDKVPGRAASDKPSGVCVYDTQTILVGDLGVVEQFLTGLKDDGYPAFKTVLSSAVEEGKGEVKGALTTVSTYRTIDIELKKHLDALEADSTQRPMIAYAELMTYAEYDPKQFKTEFKPIGDILDPVLSRAKSVAANLVTFSPKQIVSHVRIVAVSDSEARTALTEHLLPGLNDAVLPLWLLLGTNIELRGSGGPNTGPMAGGIGAPPGGAGIVGELGIGAGLPGGGSSGSVGPRPQGPGGAGGSAGATRPPGAEGSVGMRPPIGSAGPMGGGLPTAGIRPPPGALGPMGIGGQVVPGQGGTQPNPNAPPSFVELKLTDNLITLTIDVTWTDDVARRLVGPKLLGLSNQVKGKMAVYGANYGLEPLAAAVKSYTAQHKAFPRGTSDRPINPALSLPIPPAQRVSFYSELLPHMRHSRTHALPDRGLGWSEKWVEGGRWVNEQTNETTPGAVIRTNQTAAELWVPELLVHYYPPTAWRATSPLVPAKFFGGTNFVAVAGVGVGAARLDPLDPAAKAKVGITGYNWGSKLDEVTDGPDKTIYLIQVPPGLPRPWIAGGGATVVGVNESNPMADFAFARPDGERGAYAVMGNGDVRWIPEKIDPKVFLAMTTRAGGETLPDLDTVAPRVGAVKKAAELKAAPQDEIPAPKAKGSN